MRSSFGDGNGRISRFLINDMLRRDGALPASILRQEARYLRSMRTAREAIKEIVEGPDSDLDRITSCSESFLARQIICRTRMTQPPHSYPGDHKNTS